MDDPQRPTNLEDARVSLICEIAYRLELQRKMYDFYDKRDKESTHRGYNVQQRLIAMNKRVPWEDLREIILKVFNEKLPDINHDIKASDFHLEAAEKAMAEKLRAT